jgi:hypothetical protein
MSDLPSSEFLQNGAVENKDVTSAIGSKASISKPVAADQVKVSSPRVPHVSGGRINSG